VKNRAKDDCNSIAEDEWTVMYKACWRMYNAGTYKPSGGCVHSTAAAIVHNGGIIVYQPHSSATSITLSIGFDGNQFGWCETDGDLCWNYDKTTSVDTMLARCLSHNGNIDCDDGTLAHLAKMPALVGKLWQHHEPDMWGHDLGECLN
jgi:hypothetical protein